MWIELFDDGDGCTYTLNISMDDAIKIYDIQYLRKNHVELPSIGGNATLSGDDIHIMYQNGPDGLGSICITLQSLQKVIDTAMQDRADNDDDDG